MKFVIYYRVSTQQQGESGLGLEAQKRDVSLFLSNYTESYVVLESFVDVASGASSNRPLLHKAIEFAKSNKATLLVSKLDRLSRKVSFIAKTLDDPNLIIRVAQMPHADKFQLHIYAALAEQEREFISKRTKAALAEAKAKGVKLGGLRDQTNRRNKAYQQQAVQRAESIRKIIEPLYKNGATYSGIADALNSVGLLTAKGCKYQRTTVMRAIKKLNIHRGN